jgi:hypothetical protein
LYIRRHFYIPDGLKLIALLTKAGRPDLCTELFVDKCHYIIDHLYLNVAVKKCKWTDFIPLHSQVLAEVLGTRDTPRVKRALLELGIIEVWKKNGRETYERGTRSKSYRFSKMYRHQDFHSVPIEDYKFIELLEWKRVKRSKRFVRDDAVRELIARSIQNIDYDVEAAQRFLKNTRFDSPDSENAYRYAVECFKNKHWLLADDPQGRLYHNWSQMARKLRRFASYKGRSLFAADVSACQPCLLSLLYEEDCNEKQRYVEIVKCNTFYPFLNDRLRQPCDLSDDDAKGEFKQEVFHRIFYGSNWSKPTEISGIFASEFPILARLVRKAKRHHHRDLPVRLQKIEADIVINEVAAELVRCYAREDFCLISVHDCLVTTEEFVDHCAHRLRTAFGNCLGFEPTVKIKRVTEDSVFPQVNGATRNYDLKQFNSPSAAERDVAA